ncbi:hypothetical protein TIFTF001_001550 [Ficus carica]|uniref:Uncharacterized protein n=1 Tax=Ficus carica TaxID=3494 RepID=A0AA87ZGU8_FICCA|nr:hypothetical protein TIFTF001_001550 [Ficus carica]
MRKMQHQRLKQQAMMQHSLYHHPAVLAAPQKRAFRTLHVSELLDGGEWSEGSQQRRMLSE